MTNPGLIKNKEYESLSCNLATMESELGQARMLFDVPVKPGWWKQLWGGGQGKS